MAQQFEDFHKIINEIEQEGQPILDSYRILEGRKRKRSFFIYDQSNEPDAYAKPFYQKQNNKRQIKSEVTTQEKPKRQMKLSKLITTCTLNNKNPHPSANFFYQYKKLNQSSERNLLHLQKDRLELILDKEQQNFNNKKKILSDLHEKNTERLNKDYAKEYLNFQRSIDKINFDLANCVFQQTYKDSSSPDKVQLNRKQKQRFLEFLKKVQRSKEAPEEPNSSMKLNKKNSQKEEDENEAYTADNYNEEKPDNCIDEEDEEDQYKGMRIKFDPVTMQRLHAFYQQQQVKQLEQKDRVRSSIFKKESAQDKASRLIQLNVLLDKQQQNIRKFLIHKSKRKDVITKTMGSTPSKIDQQLSSSIKSNSQLTSASNLFKNSPPMFSKAGDQSERYQVSPFEFPQLQRTSLSKTQIEEVYEHSQSDIEDLASFDDGYVMQSKFTRNMSIQSKQMSEYTRDKGSKLFKQQKNQLQTKNPEKVVQGSFIDDELQHLKKLVTTMNSGPQTRSLIKSIRQFN